MQVARLEDRLNRAEDVLQKVAEGDFSQNISMDDAQDGFSGLEMGINFLILDLREMITANRMKEEQLMQQQRELERKLAKIEQQEEAIRDLSTPVMQIWDDVLMLPVVGVVDTKRSVDLMHNLLEGIVEGKAKYVILDITGVEVVDTQTADYLLKVVRAASLLGSSCVLTGVSPAVAETLVQIGADLGEVKTLRNLKAGLQHCLEGLKKVSTQQGR